MFKRNWRSQATPIDLPIFRGSDMQRHYRVALPFVLLLSGLLLCGCSTEQPAGPPGGGGPPPAKPPEVFFVTPTRDNLPDYEDCTGRTEAFKTVDVRAR